MVIITKFSLKKMKSGNKPWATKGILKLINQTKCYLEEIHQTQKSPSQEIYLLEFKRYKSMINRLTRTNKSKY